MIEKNRFFELICFVTILELILCNDDVPVMCSKVKRDIDPDGEKGVPYELKVIYMKAKEYTMNIEYDFYDIPSQCRGRRITSTQVIACDYDVYPTVNMLKWQRPTVTRMGKREKPVAIRRTMWCGSKIDLGKLLPTTTEPKPSRTVYYPPLMVF
ncbi:uncharacterized protein LOC142985178 [Anticarsia gemmatalis]|uniref:uncharacterized protein LOC142985178 n=1 Tax=Anticarsia gemmatalis TaxID=129554 RepID=UPI003F75D299